MTSKLRISWRVLSALCYSAIPVFAQNAGPPYSIDSGANRPIHPTKRRRQNRLRGSS
jgi:hypothetical protein